MAPTPSGNGYWLVATDGGIFSFGDAHFYGSTGAIHLNRPIVGMASTPSGHGYWLVASDGGIFAYGDAHFYGSTGDIHLNKPVVGMTATPDGHGYWFVATDGGIFAYGDAHFYGSTGGLRLNRPIVGMAATWQGRGYWMVGNDGGMFSFGDAHYYGSAANSHTTIVGMAATVFSHGYHLAAANGQVFSYGDGHYWGSVAATSLTAPVVTIAPRKYGAINAIPATTKIASAKATLKVSGTPTGTETITLAGSGVKAGDGGVASPKVGDVLVSGVSTLAPTGYLRRVTSVHTDRAGHIIVSTLPGSLFDAIPEPNFDVKGALTPAGPVLNSAARPASAAPSPLPAFAPSALSPNAALSNSFNMSYDHTFGPDIHSLRVTGDATLTSTFDVTGGTTGFLKPYLQAVTSSSLDVNMKATASASVTLLEDKVRILDKKLGSITFAIGPVPVVLTPHVMVDMKASASVTDSLDVHASATATMQVGVRAAAIPFAWASGSAHGSAGVGTDVGAEITSKIEPSIELLVYDATGPVINAGASITGTIKPLNRPWLSIDGKIYAGASWDFRIPLTDLHTTFGDPHLLSKTFHLADSGNTAPPPPATTTTTGVSGTTTTTSIPHPMPATAVSAGLFNTCAIVGGAVKCWGDNPFGQLGDGTNTESNVAVQVAGLTSGVTAVSAGANSCALTAAGGVKCWGINDDGELGNGTNSGPDTCDRGNACSTTPVQVVGLTSGVTAISGSCAIVGGGAKCWGNNGSGELGNGTNAGPETCNGHACSTTPVQVVGLTSGVTAISANDSSACAIVGGGAKCWGANGSGQLGNGTTTNSNVPVQVAGLTSGVTAISVGNLYTCAVVAGAAKCWGSNNYSQLGSGTNIDSSVPVQVSGLTSGATAVSGDAGIACAIVRGAAKCWGGYTALGDGVFSSSGSNVPVQVAGLIAGVSSISAGWDHACALITLGDLKCWGDNNYGEIGDGTWYWGRIAPVDVADL